MEDSYSVMEQNNRILKKKENFEPKNGWKCIHTSKTICVPKHGNMFTPRKPLVGQNMESAFTRENYYCTKIWKWNSRPKTISVPKHAHLQWKTISVPKCRKRLHTGKLLVFQTMESTFTLENH